MKIVIITAAILMSTTGIALADQALAKKLACLSCHKIDAKLVGPALKDVAAKREPVAHLAESIQKGGKGRWGTTPMPPQPNVSDDDAKKLAVWINSLK